MWFKVTSHVVKVAAYLSGNHLHSPASPSRFDPGCQHNIHLRGKIGRGRAGEGVDGSRLLLALRHFPAPLAYCGMLEFPSNRVPVDQSTQREKGNDIKCEAWLLYF